MQKLRSRKNRIRTHLSGSQMRLHQPQLCCRRTQQEKKRKTRIYNQHPEQKIIQHEKQHRRSRKGSLRKYKEKKRITQQRTQPLRRVLQTTWTRTSQTRPTHQSHSQQPRKTQSHQPVRTQTQNQLPPRTPLPTPAPQTNKIRQPPAFSIIPLMSTNCYTLITNNFN